MDPEQYPTIKIADKDFVVRFRNSDLLRIEKEGLNYQKETLQGFAAVEKCMKLLLHGLAHKYPDVTLEFLLDETEIKDLENINKVVQAAMEKAAGHALVPAQAQAQPAPETAVQ